VFGALKLAGCMTPGDYDLQVIAAERNGGKGCGGRPVDGFHGAAVEFAERWPASGRGRHSLKRRALHLE
jgi:hypothetical protein